MGGKNLQKKKNEKKNNDYERSKSEATLPINSGKTSSQID